MVNMSFKATMLLCDNMLISSTTLAMEILQFAADMTKSRRQMREEIIIRLVTADGGPVQTSTGIPIQASHKLGDIGDSDLIHIPALWRNPLPALSRHPEYLPWLIEQQRANVSITAVGTGVCFLAEAGLLDGKPATTHWHYFDRFQRRYPAVQLQRQHFSTRAGNLYCAASVNAMAELMMHILGRHFGPVVASQAQRHFFHEIRNLREPASIGEQGATRHPDEVIAQIQIWLQDNLNRDIAFADLAAQFDLSNRTFNRRFKNAVGKTPAQYLLELRMNFACDLLKNSDLNIAEVAQLSGFADSSWFATRFRQWSGSTPGAYRQTVRGKLFETGEGAGNPTDWRDKG